MNIAVNADCMEVMRQQSYPVFKAIAMIERGEI